MEILIDKPIEKMSEDRLKRKKFAINLANKLNAYKYNNPLTLGLMGKWGCGKTSIINMVLESINEENVNVIEFNPWFFSNRKQLLSDFFQLLANQIGYEDTKKDMRNLGKDLRIYAKFLKPLSLIPQIAHVIAPLSKGIDDFGSFFEDYTEFQEVNLTDIKKRIDNELKEYHKKVLVVIDEIDRLEDEEIKEIFRLVRSVGDFNNIIYLLSFDRDKVKTVFSGGEEYIDKIVNIPLYVPEISQHSINKIFKEEIAMITQSDSRLNSNYWYWIHRTVFQNKFYNLRELNRFLNIVRFNLDDIVKEVNIIDYLVITFLKIFDEGVFNFIKDNKKLLVFKSSDVTIGDIKVANIPSNRNIDVEKLLEIMFFEEESNIRRKICEYKYFDTYFQYHLGENILSLNEIHEFIDIESKQDLENLIRQYDDLFDFFDKLKEISESLNESSIYIYLDVLLRFVPLFTRQKNESLTRSEQEKIYKASEEMCQKLSVESDRIIDIIENMDIDNSTELDFLLGFLSSVILHFNNSKVKALISNKILKYLKSIEYSSKIDNNLDEIKNLGVDIYDYTKYVISTNDGLIKLLKTFLISTKKIMDPFGTSTSKIYEIAKKVEYVIVVEHVERYIPYNVIIEKVENLPSNVKVENKELFNHLYNAKPHNFFVENY
ncbi:KAP family P-loop NTPase fold protein [Wukongibacter baidiensis]